VARARVLRGRLPQHGRRRPLGARDVDAARGHRRRSEPKPRVEPVRAAVRGRPGAARGVAHARGGGLGDARPLPGAGRPPVRRRRARVPRRRGALPRRGRPARSPRRRGVRSGRARRAGARRPRRGVEGRVADARRGGLARGAAGQSLGGERRAAAVGPRRRRPRTEDGGERERARRGRAGPRPLA
jgi:hypothetical protein